MACVAALALTTVAEARLAGGRCSAKAYDELVLKEIALAKSKYNVHYSNDLLTCSTRIYKSFFDQHCSTCRGDAKCIDLAASRHSMTMNKREQINFILSALENRDCSAAIVPMYVKVIRLMQKLGRAPTEVEAVRLLFPEINLAAVGADMKRMKEKVMMKGKPALRDEDDDIGALPAALLMSPAAFKIAAIGQKVGPWIGPMRSAIMSNMRL